MNVRPAILLIHEDKLLTMHYRYGGIDSYNLPGGNVEFGESLSNTLIRELQEELQLEVSIGELAMVAEVYLPEKQKQTLHCIFEGKWLSGDPTLNPAETTALGIYWMPLSELKHKPLYPNVGQAIEAWHLNELANPYLGRITQTWL